MWFSHRTQTITVHKGVKCYEVFNHLKPERTRQEVYVSERHHLRAVRQKEMRDLLSPKLGDT